MANAAAKEEETVPWLATRTAGCAGNSDSDLQAALATQSHWQLGLSHSRAARRGPRPRRTEGSAPAARQDRPPAWASTRDGTRIGSSSYGPKSQLGLPGAGEITEQITGAVFAPSWKRTKHRKCTRRRNARSQDQAHLGDRLRPSRSDVRRRASQ